MQGSICTVVAIAALLLLQPAIAENSVEDQKGPFAQRAFSRKLGQPVTAAQLPAPVAIPGKVVFDSTTKESNELIILLDYTKAERLGQLAPGLQQGISDPEIERAIIGAALGRQRNIDLALGGPIHARYLLNVSRMSDSERAKASKLKPEAAAKGIDHNPREIGALYHSRLRLDRIGPAC